ncbi:MAG: hypothetical protein ABIM74_04310 [candidate division WOR-3 bacterium]
MNQTIMTLLLLSLILGIGSSFILYRRGPWYLLLMRALAFAMLIALLINPRLGAGKAEYPHLLVVLDLSPSMGEAMAWEDSLLGEIRSLPGEKSLLGVSGRLIRDPKTPLSVDSSDYTDLSLPFSLGADAYILLSDGLHNATSEPEPKAPVLALLPPKRRAFNLSVLGLEAPRHVNLGQEFPLTVRFALRGGDWRGRLRVSVNGELVKDSALSLSEGSGFIGLMLSVRKPGLARIRASFSPDVQGDPPDDNARTRSIAVEKGGFEVFLIADGPWPDVGAVRRALEGVPGISLRSFVRVAGGRWAELVGDSVRDSGGPEGDADALVLIGSRRELGRYLGKSPCLVFMSSDPWGIPGASEYAGDGIYLSPAPGSPIPDSVLRGIPPLTRFWRVPTNQAQEVMLSAGAWPIVFRREGVLYVASPALWAQNNASGGELYRLILSDFVSKALSEGLALSAWAEDLHYGQPGFVNAEARLADGSPAEDIWPRIGREPMRKIGPGVFQSGPLALEPGDHSLRVDFYRGGEVVGSKTVGFSVSPWPAEAYDWGVDTNFLRGLSEGSGGFIARSPEDIRRFIEGMRTQSPPLRFLDLPWLLILPVLLLGAEWGIRRWLGRV